MTSSRTLARMERVIWILIFAGLFAAIVGVVARSTSAALGWSLLVAGSLAAGVGVLLIWLRSRLQADAPPADKVRG